MWTAKQLQSLLWPRQNRLLRLLLTAAVALIIFSTILLPFRVTGESMAPRYQSGRYNFCWAPAYWFSQPRRFDVVLISLTGSQVMLLKRIVALPGETIAFRDGQTLINGQPLAEPHVKRRGNWTMPPREVAPGTVYLVGDNRAMGMESHLFGAAARKRIKGRPLW